MPLRCPQSSTPATASYNLDVEAFDTHAALPADAGMEGATEDDGFGEVVPSTAALASATSSPDAGAGGAGAVGSPAFEAAAALDFVALEEDDMEDFAAVHRIEPLTDAELVDLAKENFIEAGQDHDVGFAPAKSAL